VLPQRLEIADDGTVRVLLTIGPDGHYVADDHLSLAGVVEAMAQAAAVHPDLADGGRRPPPGVLVGVENLEVTALPALGQEVAITCSVERLVGPLLRVRADLAVDDRAAASGTIKIFLADEHGP
jgi:predicted hotdog family 3-hydroxylacyl-ACP dehydratase